MKKSIRTPIAVLLLVFLTLTVLIGCESALINNGMHRAECEAYLDAMLAGDFEAAHAITPAIDREEHRAYFEESRKALEGATTYTLTQTGWKSNYNNGVATHIAAYQIVTDNGVTCQFSLQTTDGVEGISHIAFRDSTAFIASTRSVGTINLVLTFVSLIPIAFNLWMIVDCALRKINPLHKLWCMLICLLSLCISFTVGNESFFTRFSLGTCASFTTLEAIIPNETVVLTIALPIGALIYFFLRKKLSARYAAQQAQLPFTFPPTPQPTPVPQPAHAPESGTVPLPATDFTTPEEPSNQEPNANE